MDTTTGLLYVGNGQYYDPSTGRFLNRNVNPNSANPYVPLPPSGMLREGGEPTGALIAPLVLLAILYGRKKRRGKLDTLIILLVLCVGIGMSLAACGLTRFKENRPQHLSHGRHNPIRIIIPPRSRRLQKLQAERLIRAVTLRTLVQAITIHPQIQLSRVM